MPAGLRSAPVYDPELRLLHWVNALLVTVLPASGLAVEALGFGAPAGSLRHWHGISGNALVAGLLGRLLCSAARGEKFFLSKNTKSDAESIACARCHTENPKAIAQTGAHKAIQPLAPVANRERFTDPAKVEKWFNRNCRDVLERACTAHEKADFIAYLIPVK